MNYLLWGFPWYVWLIFLAGLIYIGFILWFCRYGSTQSFNKKTHKYCFLIIIFTIVLILANILTIALVL